MQKIHNKTSILMGLFAVAAVAACAPFDPETGKPAELRSSPETTVMAKQINVEELKPVFIVRFDDRKAAFTDLQKGRLLGFVEAQGARFGEELQVELPPFNDAEGVNEVRFGAIGSFLESQGFAVVPKVSGEGLRNSLRVYYSKYVATVDPDCARGWRRPAGTSYENLPIPHMGCATASALAQMIEKPKDLVSPNTPGGYNGYRAAAAIMKYRGGAGGGSKGGSSGGSSEAAK